MLAVYEKVCDFLFSSDQSNLFDSAFSAKDLAADMVTIVKNTSDRIIFINVTVNMGNHYNSTTGEYTCPINGLYFFSFMVQGSTISSSLGQFGPFCSLVYNGNNVARARLDNANSEQINAVLSGSAVVNCKARYKVWVKSTKNNNRLFSVRDFPGNVFSGFLIAPETHK